MSLQQTLTKKWELNPKTNLPVNGIPLKKSEKHSQISTTHNQFLWQDLQGAAWLFKEEDWS